MQSQWSDKTAKEYIERYAGERVSEDLALRVYTSRLLGRDPALVLHGGGNTSVKTTQTDMYQEAVRVLCVKGSGWDMADIEPAGLPAVRLEPLQKARALSELSDEAMVNCQRSNLLDMASPNPSVETLLHAFLPHKFVDHTHSTAVLALIDQPDGMDRARDVYGTDMGIVPYIMPGFKLACAAADCYDTDPSVRGLILHKHGIFTFGESADEAYETMIEMVTKAENTLNRKVFMPAKTTLTPDHAAHIAPLLRGACSESEDKQSDDSGFVLSFRSNADILNFVNGDDLSNYGQRGVVTPDHIIRTKNTPLIINPPDASNPEKLEAYIKQAMSNYRVAYDEYFERNNSRVGHSKIKLDSTPRIIVVPGVGFFGVGRSAKAANCAADLYENTIEVITQAESVGKFEPLPEADLFDMEYWSLEQAKLNASKSSALAGQIVVITGAAGAIGKATAKAFKAAGCEVALIDKDKQAVSQVAADVGGFSAECDVTDSESVERAFNHIVENFGGLDIVVSNAGAAWQGAIGSVSDQILRESFELNFFAHQSIAQTAVRIMEKQKMGGCLLFNVSKQSVNPGTNFGPYGLPKAALLFLVRQYALDHGDAGIRSNGVNADRIRSGILSDDMIKTRSEARGVSQSDYLKGNLLGREVRAEDVAQAFVALAEARATTAHITTVDGGNIEAALR